MTTWTIEEMDCENIAGETNVVVKVTWKVSGGDDINTCYCKKTSSFAHKSGSSFTPYSELTQAQVLGWIKNIVSGSGAGNYMDHINEQINKQIAEKVYTQLEVSETDLPWSETSGSVVTPEPTDTP